MKTTVVSLTPVYAFDAARRRGCRVLSVRKRVQGLLRLAGANGLPSGLQKAWQPVADLLMREMVAILQSVLTAFDGFDEVVLFFERVGNNVLHKLGRVPTLLVRTLREAGLQLRFEVDLHAFHDRG